MDNILEVKDLTKSFPDFQLGKISLALPRGYVMGFVGPNGSGKTTTIKLIMNLLRRDSGQISIFSLDNRIHEKEVKQRIGFVYDENYFYDTLTLQEMKSIIAPFYRDWDEALFRKYMSEFNCRQRKDQRSIPGHEDEVSPALSHHAEFIIMDEPTSGLDRCSALSCWIYCRASCRMKSAAYCFLPISLLIRNASQTTSALSTMAK